VWRALGPRGGANEKIIASFLAVFGIGTQAVSAENQPQANQMTQELRMMALNLSPDSVGLSANNFTHEVWGVLMETGMEGGSYSLVVIADGSTSLYFSNGGGIIGAGEHAPVKEASKNFIGLANKYVSQSKPTSSFPLPNEGRTIFYFLTFHGVKAYEAKEIELGEERDPLSNLFHAGHAVIAEARKASAK
jgi:hypothetical protein